MAAPRLAHSRRAVAGAALALSPLGLGAQTRAPFVVTDTAVRQGRFEAIATSRDTILSSYPRAAREVRFRFSINGAENEFPPGTEHTIYLRPIKGQLVTRLYRFGDETEPPPPSPEGASSEDGIAQVTFRVDMRQVLHALQTQGAYRPPLGATITRGEAIHVYVVGDPAPLDWDYTKLHPGSVAELHDADGDGIYEGTVPIPTEYTRPRTSDGRAIWARSTDISMFPQLTSSERMQDAVYRLSLEELRQLVRPDSALSAGAKWPGVWTRDVSLSTILSLAIVAPDAARRSLMAKVDSTGRIIQDTGTGGSWPVSTDRMVWALAAWEVYGMTGDRAWLQQAYDVTRRSALADLHAVRDPSTGLMNGESSFMDWREQSYPRWMQPADIYESQVLSTNAVHYAAYRTLARMARALGQPAAAWDSVADGIGRAMTTQLWQQDRGYFAEYRYGRTYHTRSPRAEGLGEALASIYGAASLAERQRLMRRAPVTTFGTPSFWPFIPGERFYHNATIWPFVTAYWTWAAAEGENTTAVRRGLDDATRTVALFLTNKENTVASTGHYEGTALNSDRQLWSVAGTLSGTYRILFGMRLEPDRLVLRPMVPPSYGGTRTLSRVHYRGAVLTITVRGSGNGIASVRLDGHGISRAEVPASLTGAHTIEITMNGHWPAAIVNEVPSRFAPATPRAVLDAARLSWTRIPSATGYVVFRDGRASSRTADTSMAVQPGAMLAEYQVLAVDSVGDESFLSEPVRVTRPRAALEFKPSEVGFESQYTGFTGSGYVTLSLTRRTGVTFRQTVASDGLYAIDLRYANGNGPVNTEDKVAVRTLLVDDDTLGVMVMPQRGTGNWSDWGWSNVRVAHLTAGQHTFRVVYTPLDANMNRRENTALLDVLRLTPLDSSSSR